MINSIEIQVMKKVIKIFILLLIVAVFVGTIVFLYQKSKKSPKKVAIGTPFITDIVKKTVVTGAVIPRKEIEIKPQIIGIIDEIYTHAGDIVKEGDLIAKIKVTPNMVTLNNAETRFNQAKIALEDAMATYERQKKFYDESFNDGHLVIQNSNPHMVKLSSALFKLDKARLILEDEEKGYERQKMLLQKSIITPDEFQNTELALEKAKTDFKEANDNYQLIKEETLELIEQEYQKTNLALNKANAEFISARNNLQLIKEGVTDENVDDANTLIRSTTDGMVLDIMVKEGNLVIESSTSNVGTTVAVVADMNDMIFEGSIDESEIGKIKEGMELILTIGAIENRTFHATIEYIAPKGKKVSGAVQFDIRAKLELRDSLFVRAGYSANADIVLDKKTGVLAVEEAWLQFEGEKTYVEVETQSQVFEKKEVTVGLSDSINIEIVSGLTENDKVRIPD